jgi:hypothetical protein
MSLRVMNEIPRFARNRLRNLIKFRDCHGALRLAMTLKEKTNISFFYEKIV